MISMIQTGVETGWFSQFAFPAALLLMVLGAIWKAFNKFSPLLVEHMKAHVSLVKALEEAVKTMTASQTRIEELLSRVIVNQREEKEKIDV